MTTLPPRRMARRADRAPADQPARCVTRHIDEPAALQKREAGLPSWNLERETSLELATSTLARLRSTN